MRQLNTLHLSEVSNVLVLVLYRHAMQNAMVAYPETRKAEHKLSNASTKLSFTSVEIDSYK